MPLHDSPSLPQIRPIHPRIPPAAERTDGRKAARFWDVMNVADRPLQTVAAILRLGKAAVLVIRRRSRFVQCDPKTIASPAPR
jgi:hypothetical protein